VINEGDEDEIIDNNPLTTLSINSNYGDITDLVRSIRDKSLNNNVTALHINIRSLPGKFEEFKEMLGFIEENNVHVDFILLCETFLNEHNAHLYELPGYKFEYKNRRIMQRGGVAIYVRDNIHYKVRTDLNMFIEGEFEAIFLETVNIKKTTIIGEIYRPPGCNLASSLERYDELFSKIKHYKHIMIGMDQNVDLLKIDSHQRSMDFFNTIITNGLVPTITKPTRITATTATIKDNIYVKYSDGIDVSSGILVNDLSDHLPVYCNIKYKTKSNTIKSKSKTFTHRKVTEHALVNIKYALQEKDWQFLEDIDIEESSKQFSRIIQNLFDIHAPLKTITIPAKHLIREPWMSKGLLKSSHTCVQLYRDTIKKPKTHPVTKAYLKYRNSYYKLKRKAKQMYYTKLFNDYQYDIRRTWQTINNLIGKTSTKSTLAQVFKTDQGIVSDPHKIANEFNMYFSTIGHKLACDISASNKTAVQYLHTNSRRNQHSIFLTPTNEDEILKIIGSLKNKKSFGHDGISTISIKSISNSIAYPLSILINKSIETGKVPETYKLAKVIPIHKNKTKDQFSNYRPISLLPVFSKILEKAMHCRMQHFLEHHDLLYSNQYGFRRKHSTIDAITRFTTDTVRALDKKQSTLAVYLDLSKAFDTINHIILLNKLEYYGIRGTALAWFKSYLENRSQFVEFNNHQSDVCNYNCGVPQGSILGPLLFIIYTNDIPNNLNNVKTILFADDTTIYLAHTNPNTLFVIANREMETVTDWFRANKLSLNIDKTKYMIYSNKIIDTVNKRVLLCNRSIERTNCMKFLGVHIDDKLKWDKHINNILLKLTRSSYAIYKMKDIMTRVQLRMLYNALVQPYLSYGIILWGATFRQHTHKLIIMQKRIVRRIYGARYDAHTSPIFRSLKFLKLDDLYKLEVAKHILKSFKMTMPKSLMDLYIPTYIIHNLHTRHRTRYRLSKPNTRILLTSQSILYT